MSLVTVGSVVGSPGATTTAFAMVRHRPQTAVLVEADPDGGRVATWLNTDHRPGLIDLLTSVRDLPLDELLAWVQRLDDRSSARVVVAHPSGDIVDRALRAGVQDLVGRLDQMSLDVVCDVGRYRIDSPAGPLIEAASCRVVVTRGSLEQVAVLSHALERLRQWGPLVVAVTGSGPYAAGEVGQALGVVAVDVPGGGAVLPHRRADKAIEQLAQHVWNGVPR